MTKNVIYLDHASTTPIREEVLEMMLPILKNVHGNPASIHAKGREASNIMAKTRKQLADIFNTVSPDSFIFTSGGTESNNIALKGAAFSLEAKGRHIITSQIEHSSVMESCKWLSARGWEITYLPVDSEGFIDPLDLEASIRPETVLISLMHGNNEVGTLQAIEQLGNVARTHQILFHADAVQTVGNIPVDLGKLPVDMLSCSAHKLYGPKGIGFLYLGEKARSCITPLLHGGGQENRLRSGTENIYAIAGMGKAIELAVKEQVLTTQHLRSLQSMLIQGIREHFPDACLNGPANLFNRLAGNVNFSFPSMEGESMVLKLDLKGIAASSGSACHSGEGLRASHVLMAMGADEERAKSTLRFSLGKENTSLEIEQLLKILPEVLNKPGCFSNKQACKTT